MAEDGHCPEPATVYLAVDEQHLSVTRGGRSRVEAAPPVGGRRPSATMLFSSIAEIHGAAAAAVVRTGMGTDGLAGLHEVHRAGGHALVQDEVSSVVFGMPDAAVQVGITDLSTSVADVTERVVELTQQEEA